MSAIRSASQGMLASYPSASRLLQGARESRGEQAVRGARLVASLPRTGIANPIVVSLDPST